MDKIIKVKLKGFSLLTNIDSKGENLKIKGYVLDNDPDVVYRVSWFTADEEVELKQQGVKKIVKIDEVLYDKLKKDADRTLDRYINENIENKSFYNEKDGEGNYVFWNRELSFDGDLNIMDQVDRIIKYAFIDLSELKEGKIVYRINHTKCVYNIVRNEYIEISRDKHAGNGERADVTPFDIFYKDTKNIILASEQYELGTAHPLYAEIVKLNTFLKGKKSVRLIFKDGAEHVYRPGYNIRASSFMTRTHIGYHLTNAYGMNPVINKRMGVNELDYLQHGKQKYYIDAENMQIS